MTNTLKFGTLDASYQAAGQLEGIIKLVDAFYDYMERLPEAAEIRAMHREDLSDSRKKLSYFLSGWLGGPKLYKEHFGGISIPQVHSHLKVGAEQRNAWMLCMKHALKDQDYSDDFKKYMFEQLSVPAERIRQVCSHAQDSE
ncbi:group II truncated hemoglobin [Agaribacterium sp. ZY112]|uniref:group II truncated hemoglobin n=1 Tax=Agaribacterium sp. ZY112 TaxID=3233574 RepID=UPI0035246551